MSKPMVLDPDLSPHPGITLSRRVPLSALSTLFALSASRMIRGRRLLILSLLFLLPTLFTLLAQRYGRHYEPRDGELAFIFVMIPQALVPLASLIYASGMVQDEIEEQTLTYLLLRPIPRWLVYLTKLTATVVVTSLMASLFATLCIFVIHEGSMSSPSLKASHVLGICGLLSLSIAAYCSLFGLMSLLLRRTLVLGVTYIILFEGILANIDFVVRKLTIMFYFRVLSIRWLGQVSSDWSINLKTAPDAWTCLLTLAIAAVVLAGVAALIFDRREFRMKTPESA